MRLRRIAFALSSCTKAQTEHLNADDNAPFIPISTPAWYPMRIPINRGLSSYARSLSSLTRLERVKTPGCAEARRKRGKRIPFFRCNTLSTLNLRIAVSSGSDLTPSTELNRNFIDETKSLRTTLTAENIILRQKPSRDQLSKHIKHLRGKFGSVSEENHSSMQSNCNSDTDLIQSLAINSKEKKTSNETKTSIMASLLIGSIRNMPLEDVGTDNLTSIVPSDDQLTTTNNDEVSEAYCEENPQENEEIKSERQDNTSIDETEISSFYDDDNSSGNESSNGTTSYNILDSRYSLDDDRTADSSSLQERIPITIRSSAESCTDSTLQVDSDVAMSCQLSSNPDLTNTKDIELRNNVIPVITVDIHESADSDTSNNESSNITTLARTDIFVSKSISSSDEREIDDVVCKIDASENFKSEKIDNSLHQAYRDVHLTTKHERDPCRSPSNGQPAQLESPSPAEPENYISTDREENDLAIDLPRTTTRRVSVSKKESRVKAIVDERRRCMRDLIELIDTKMMVPTHGTHHSKRAVSLKSKKRKRERKMHKKNANASENSLEKVPSHRTSTRRHATLHRRRRGEDIPFRISRVHSIPDYLCSKQQPNVSIFHTISRSCDSSLVSLTDYRVSRGSKRSALLSPTAPTFDDSSEIISRQLPNSSRSKSGTVSAASVNGATRKRPSTIYNLKKASCHIDNTKPTNTANITHNSCVSRPSPDLRQQDEASVSPSCPLPAVSSMTVKMSQSPATRTLANVPLHRRSSDSDLSVTPKGEFFLPPSEE